MITNIPCTNLYNSNSARIQLDWQKIRLVYVLAFLINIFSTFNILSNTHPLPREKLEVAMDRPSLLSRKVTRKARGIRAGWNRQVEQRYTNMAGSELEDLALLEAKVVNEAAVVELIRRRYSQNKIYVSKVFAARARFLSNSCYLLSYRIMQTAMSFC